MVVDLVHTKWVVGAEHVRERAQHLRVVHRGWAQSEAWRDRTGDVDVLRPRAVLEQQERALECRRRLARCFSPHLPQVRRLLSCWPPW